MRRSLVAGSSLLAGLAMMAFGASPGFARAPGPTFVGTAGADGIRTVLTADGAPISNTPYDGGDLVAQAAFDPAGSSSAFGSVLYPGDTVSTSSGLVGGFSNGALPAPPPYPLVARADGFTPDDEVTVPGSRMHASVSGNGAEASASTGTDGSDGGTHVTADAAVRLDSNGRPLATARSMVAGLEVPGLVLGEARAQWPRSRCGVDGVLQRSSSFVVAPFDVGGLRVAVGPEGLELAGTDVPLDAGGPVSDLLVETLAPHGVTLQFLPQEQTPSGVISAGLRIVLRSETGAAVSAVEISQTIGRAQASITAGASVPPDPAGPVGPVVPQPADQTVPVAPFPPPAPS